VWAKIISARNRLVRARRPGPCWRPFFGTQKDPRAAPDPQGSVFTDPGVARTVDRRERLYDGDGVFASAFGAIRETPPWVSLYVGRNLRDNTLMSCSTRAGPRRLESTLPSNAGADIFTPTTGNTNCAHGRVGLICVKRRYRSPWPRLCSACPARRLIRRAARRNPDDAKSHVEGESLADSRGRRITRSVEVPERVSSSGRFLSHSHARRSSSR